MFAKRSLSALSSSERQLIRSQWMRSGQCARCFHASRHHQAEDESGKRNDQGTPYNVPQRGPSRHERSAKISNELSMLQKGPPPSGDLTGPGSVTGTYHAPPAAPTTSEGFLETPNDMSGGRMGENESAGREGPNAQGVGRPIRYEDRRGAPQDTSKMARVTSNPRDVQGPAEGGASVLGSAAIAPQEHHPEWVERSGRVIEEDAEDAIDKAYAAEWKKARLLDSYPEQKAAISPHITPRLWKRSQGAATSAGNNFDGVIFDRLQSLVVPYSPAQKPRRVNWVAANKHDRRRIVDQMVRGNYGGSTMHGQSSLSKSTMEGPVLGEVWKKTMLNSSFARGDAERLAKKVQSLLPAARPAQAAKKGPAKKATV